MFDEFPDINHTRRESAPRLLALRFLSSFGACLAPALARIGDEAGAALAHALRDMMIDPTIDPMHWPIDETLAMLRQPSAQPDAQVDRLIARLSHLRDRIDASFG